MKLAYPFLTAETTSPLLGYRGKQEEVFPRLKELGYNAIELLVRDPEKIDLKEIKTLLKENDLQVAAVSTAPIVSDDQLTFTSADQNQRRAAIQRVKEMIVFAAQLNSPIHIGKLRGNLIAEEKEVSFAWMCQSFREIGEYAYNHGVEIAIEPQNEKHLNYMNTTVETLEFINTIQLPSLKIMLDTYHMNISEKSIYASLKAAQDKLIFMHFADDNRKAPGQGEMSFYNIFNILKTINYEGFISMEIKQDPTSYLAAKTAIEHCSLFKKKFK